MTESVLVSLRSADNRQGKVEGTRVCFSVYQCFAVMDDDSRALLRRLATIYASSLVWRYGTARCSNRSLRSRPIWAARSKP